MLNRETKIVMIVGFVAVLSVSILFVDHLSGTGRNSPASPLDVDPLLGQGLVVSVLPSDPARPQPAALNPFADSIPNGLRSLTNAGASMIDETAQQFGELRGAIRPESASQLLAGEPMGPPSLVMGRPTAPGQNGVLETLAEVEVHRVVAGETLWRIAERYYADPSLHRALAEYNKDRLTSAGQPRAGATILIPPRALLVPDTTRTTTPSSSPSPGPAPQRPTPTGRTYEVKRGDTLSQISQRELGTARRWREILELNSAQLKDENDLRVGMRLKLPAR